MSCLALEKTSKASKKCALVVNRGLRGSGEKRRSGQRSFRRGNLKVAAAFLLKEGVEGDVRGLEEDVKKLVGQAKRCCAGRRGKDGFLVCRREKEKDASSKPRKEEYAALLRGQGGQSVGVGNVSGTLKLKGGADRIQKKTGKTPLRDIHLGTIPTYRMKRG